MEAGGSRSGGTGEEIPFKHQSRLHPIYPKGMPGHCRVPSDTEPVLPAESFLGRGSESATGQLFLNAAGSTPLGIQTLASLHLHVH